MVAKLFDPALIVPEAATELTGFWDELALYSEIEAGISKETHDALWTNLNELDFYNSGNPEAVMRLTAVRRMLRIIHPSRQSSDEEVEELEHSLRPNYGTDRDYNHRRLLANSIGEQSDPVVLILAKPELWHTTDGLPGLELESWRVVKVEDPDSAMRVGLQALREECVLNKPSIRDLEGKAHDLYPDIKFSDTFWNRANKYSDNLAPHLSNLIHHIGVLNDEAVSIFEGATTDDEIEQQFSMRGMEASNENGEAKKGRLGKAREAKFDGKKLACSWHLKYKRPTARVHFLVQDGRIYLGDAVDHLPTKRFPKGSH